jgi:hypothetical protein
VRPDELDAWLPRPAVLTRHERHAPVPAAVLWEAAHDVRLSDTGTLGRLVRWRIPGTPEHETYRGMLAQYPFVVLEEGERFSVSGLCGRIWTLQRDYPRLGGAAEFRAWAEPGTVKVLFAHWVQDGELVSEARVKPVDRRAAVRLRAVWLAIGHWERLIGAEPLRLAVRRAELG